MIFIDLEHKRPTDRDIPGWMPWTQAQWNDWLTESARLVREMADLEAAGKRDERNALIDANGTHWGALKQWLLALSGGKCWFSGVRDLYAHYDVEHFRPKKVAKSLDSTARDGYWWLAFDYMNYRICGNVGNRKKGGWFPLRVDSPCSRYEHRCEGDEVPHFLDPTNAHDVTLLAYDEEGKAVPAPGVSEWESERVQCTVERLKLVEHQALTEERRKVWQKTSTLISRYLEAISTAQSSAAARERAKATAREIVRITRPETELCSVAKWCVLLRNEALVTRLISA